MLSEDNILTIRDFDFGNSWEMRFDLNVIVEQAGNKGKERWQDEKGYSHTSTFTLMNLSQVRRIVKMILEYADPEDLDAVDGIFRKNEKLYRIWRAKRNAEES